MNGWLGEWLTLGRAGGPLLAVIALASLGIWMYFGRSRTALARALREGRPVADLLDTLDTPTDPVGLARRVAQMDGGVAALVAVALEDVAGGAPVLEAFRKRTENALEILRRDFLPLAALTAAAPLLGLLGTVTGMIETFEALAHFGGDMGGRMAGGISRALLTTQIGLLVALPGVFGLARLEGMLRDVEQLMATCRVHAANIIERRPA